MIVGGEDSGYSHVRLGYLPDIKIALTDVCFRGNIGHFADVLRCRFLTQSGHCAAKRDALRTSRERPARLLESTARHGFRPIGASIPVPYCGRRSPRPQGRRDAAGARSNQDRDGRECGLIASCAVPALARLRCLFPRDRRCRSPRGSRPRPSIRRVLGRSKHR
jgi:hypothetical protein